MPVSKKSVKNYYSFLKNSEKTPEGGRIRHVDRNGNEEFFGDIEGILVGIELVKDEYEGAVNWKYHFKFEDQAHQQIDILQVGETSSAARGLLTTLVSCEEPIGWVKVSPYLKDSDGTTYTNVWTEVNGATVDWKDEVKAAIPDVVETKNAIGEKQIDDSERRMFFRRIAKNITQKRLAGHVTHERVDPETGEVTSGGPVNPNAPQLNGGNGAEDMYARPEGEPPKHPAEQEKPEEKAGVDMSGWDDIEDDGLPFSWIIILLTAGKVLGGLL